MAKFPKWFWWTEWWHGSGSDKRYEPRWWERRAYIEGLQDAMRIMEANSWEDVPKCELPQYNGATRRAVPGINCIRAGLRKIHVHALRKMRWWYEPGL